MKKTVAEISRNQPPPLWGGLGRGFYLIFLLFHLTFLTSDLHAQKLKTLLESGDKAFADNDFFAASIYYNKAILQDSIDLAIQYKYAEASRLNYDYEIAEYWYAKIFKTDAQGKLYPDAVFWLATMKKNKGKYKDARKLFDKYAKKNKKKKTDYLVKKAVQEVAACDYAVLLTASLDKSIKIIHLDTSVNSKVSEYAPIQLDSVLYFSSLRDGSDRDKKNDLNYNKIYTSDSNSKKDSVKWFKARELDTLFNKEGVHNANTAFNADLTKVYITRCEQKNAQDFLCEIYFSDYKNKHWSPLQKLPTEINEKGYTNTQPAIGYLGDQEVLFFSSNRPGGEGKMDIWYSTVNKDGTYGKPVNAGKKVNSLDDEITPFYCKPCQELFFSSNWHTGLGGFDIFKSDFKNKTLGEPKNLGLPINSSYNDIYFSISTKRTAAFLSSNRKGSYFEEKESCCNDIYMFRIPGAEEPPQKVDSTQIFVAQMKLLVPLTLYFHNDEPDKKTLAITTTKNYKKTYEDYSAMREQYKKEYSKGAKGSDLDRATNDIDVLFEDSIDAGMQDLEKFAQLLLKVLKDGEKVAITMKGFCSPLASTDYNVNLAKRRISSLRNYFMEYQAGVFVPYVNNTKANEGNISFFEEEIGELKTKPNVSDDYYDTKNSIYNPAAALERKIQIIAISTVSSKNIATQVTTEIKEAPKDIPVKENIPVKPTPVPPIEETKKTPKDVTKENIPVKPTPVTPVEETKKTPKDLPKENIPVKPTPVPPVEEAKKAAIPVETKPAPAASTANTTLVITQAENITLQVTGLSQLDKAQEVQSILKSLFKQTISIVTEDGLHKVRISGLKNREEAKSLLPQLNDLGFKDAFIVTPKK